MKVYILVLSSMLILASCGNKKNAEHSHSNCDGHEHAQKDSSSLKQEEFTIHKDSITADCKSSGTCSTACSGCSSKEEIVTSVKHVDHDSAHVHTH